MDRSSEIIALSITLISMTVVAVGLRILTRLVKKIRIGWDDWVTVMAMAFTVCLCSINIVCKFKPILELRFVTDLNALAVQFGLGKPPDEIDPKKSFRIVQVSTSDGSRTQYIVANTFKIIYFVSLFYAVTHWFIKMAILLTFARLFTLNFTWFKWTVYGLMTYVTIWALSIIITINTAWYGHNS